MFGRKRRGRPRSAGQYKIADLHQRQHEVANLVVLGKKNVDIAKFLGVTPECVSAIKRMPLVQEKIHLLRAVRDDGCMDVRKTLEENSGTALSLLLDIQNGQGAGADAPLTLRANTAKHLLECVAISPIKRIEGDIRVGHHITAEEIDNIRERVDAERRRAMSRALDGEDVVDVEVVEDEPISATG